MLYTYKTCYRLPVHDTTHCTPTRLETSCRGTYTTRYTPTRPVTGRRCTIQHTVPLQDSKQVAGVHTQHPIHLQDPWQVAGAQPNTLYTNNTIRYSPNMSKCCEASWYSTAWWHTCVLLRPSKLRRLIIMNICDRILENHPYGHKWNSKYLALKSSIQLWISTHIWLQ